MNTRQKEAQPKAQSGKSNGARLAGIVFLFIVVCTLLLTGLVVVKWMNSASHLPLSKLVVTGKKHYTTDDEIRQAILSLGQPGTFMSQDVNVIQQQIERFPWIQQVSVRKQWPDQLKIHLVEYVPYARWNDNNVIDGNGKVFSVPLRFIGNEPMPMLYGPEGSEQEVLRGYHEIKQMLAKHHIELKLALMTARRSWQLVTSDDVRIELGRNEISKRVQRFIDLWPIFQKQAVAEKKRVSHVDLRYATGAAVGWAPAFMESQDENQQQNQTQAKQQ